MTSLHPAGAVAVVAVGLVAGAVNTVVGSGSLLTFPTLLALGYPALTANVTNTIGLVPGSLSGAIGYRRELAGQRERLIRLGVVAGLGGLLGGVLLLVLPAGVFLHVVPVLVLLAVVLVAVQPRLAARLRPARDPGPDQSEPDPAAALPGWPLMLAIGLIAVYGGYFGAAVGVLLLGLLGVFIDDALQRLNAGKNVLAFVVNAVASVLFAVAAPVAWLPALLLAVSSFVGGQLGALVGRRLPPRALRIGIIVVGLAVSIKLFISP